MVFDQCRYGAPTRKPTQILYQGARFDQLEANCDHEKRRLVDADRPSRQLCPLSRQLSLDDAASAASGPAPAGTRLDQLSRPPSRRRAAASSAPGRRSKSRTERSQPAAALPTGATRPTAEATEIPPPPPPPSSPGGVVHRGRRRRLGASCSGVEAVHLALGGIMGCVARMFLEGSGPRPLASATPRAPPSSSASRPTRLGRSSSGRSRAPRRRPRRRAAAPPLCPRACRRWLSFHRAGRGCSATAPCGWGSPQGCAAA